MDACPCARAGRGNTLGLLARIPIGRLGFLGGLIQPSMRVKDATDAYQEVIRLAPDPISRARAMVDLGALDRRIGQDPDAEKLWATALVQLPNEGSVWLWLGDLYQQQRRWPAAVHAFQQGVTTHHRTDGEVAGADPARSSVPDHPGAPSSLAGPR